MVLCSSIFGSRGHNSHPPYGLGMFRVWGLGYGDATSLSSSSSVASSSRHGHDHDILILLTSPAWQYRHECEDRDLGQAVHTTADGQNTALPIIRNIP